MRNLVRLIPLALVAALCVEAPSYAAPLQAQSLFRSVQGSLSADLPAAARGARVQIDRQSLTTLGAGATLALDIPGVGHYAFRIVRAASDGGVLRIEGTLGDDASHRLVLGVRDEGVSGVISTPAGVYSLGYVNGEQWLGAAGATDRLLLAQGQRQPRLMSERTAPPREQAPVEGALPVTLNLPQLTAMQPGEEALLTLPDLGTLRVTYEETQPNADSDSWVGYLKDFGKDYRVLLTYSPTGTTGHILTPQGEVSIESAASGQSWLIDPRRSGLTRKEGDEACEVATPPAGAAEAQAPAQASATQDAAAPAPSATATAVTATVVDVLVLYSASFVTDKGGVAQAEAAVDHLVALTNQAYKDSGASLQVRKAGTLQVSVADTSSNGSVLTAMTNGTGAFGAVRAKRDALGADLVSIVRPFQNQYHGGCGVAWIGGYNGSSITGSSAYAYSVVSEGRDRAGSGWYCDITSFAHELGHNQGLMHDRATVARQGGGQGATPYAYGYGIAGTFGTVMSYIWPKVGKFSNPNDTTCGGSLRCGVPSTDTARSADNAQALNYTRTGVAAFRTAPTLNPPPAKVSISGLLTLNGAPRRSVAISGTGAACVVGTNAVYRCEVARGWTGTLTPRWVQNGRAAVFTPLRRGYSNMTTSRSNQNFNGVW